MSKIKENTFKPVPSHSKVYDELYGEYERLYHYFGRKENNVMKRLKGLANKNNSK